MDVTKVKERVRGPVAPVLTIYEEDLSINLDAIQENVDQLVHRGMTTGNGTLLCASGGGDLPLLSHQERKAVIEAVVQAAGDRATVLGCAQSPATSEAIELAQWSQKVGCYGILLSPTWYYSPNQRQVYDHFKAVSESVDICVMVYNTPWFDAHVSIDLLKRLRADFDNVRASKWSALDSVEEMAGYVELADECAMIQNGPSVLQGALLGANGFVTHLANVWPEHELAFWKLVESGDYIEATEAFLKVNWHWRQLRIWAGRITSGGSPPVKPAAEMIGFHGGPCRPPMVTLNEEGRAHVRFVLDKIGAPLTQEESRD